MKWGYKIIWKGTKYYSRGGRDFEREVYDFIWSIFKSLLEGFRKIMGINEKSRKDKKGRMRGRGGKKNRKGILGGIKTEGGKDRRFCGHKTFRRSIWISIDSNERHKGSDHRERFSPTARECPSRCNVLRCPPREGQRRAAGGQMGSVDRQE